MALAQIVGFVTSFLDSSTGWWAILQLLCSQGWKKIARGTSKKYKQNLLFELTPLSVGSCRAGRQDYVDSPGICLCLNDWLWLSVGTCSCSTVAQNETRDSRDQRLKSGWNCPFARGQHFSFSVLPPANSGEIVLHKVLIGREEERQERILMAYSRLLRSGH